MIVYNITIKINPEIKEEWLNWQREEHIPEIMATGLFTEHRFFQLLDEEDNDGLTYVIQYFSPSFENYQKYIDEYAPLLRKKAFTKWNNKFVAFRTVMQVVN